MKIIDLFSGCGGLSEGFKEANLDVSLSIDWEKKCCETLEYNLKKRGVKDSNKKVLCFDIQKTKDLLNGWKGLHPYAKKGISQIKNVDIIIGGPPCQAYSVAGRIRGENAMKDDYRNYLFESYLKVVDYFKPKVILFENVPGMLSATPGGISVIDRIKKAFDKSGYELIENIKKYAIFNTADYGVPQNRKRIILIGLKRKHFGKKSQELLKEMYEKIIPKYKINHKLTVRDAIGDLDKFFPNKKNNKGKLAYLPTSSEQLNHKPRFHSDRDISIFKKLAKDISSGKGIYRDANKLKELYTKMTGKTSALHKYHVLDWDKPSNTIVAHLYKDGLRHIHPDEKQGRTITVREASRIQTFSDDFEFLGSQSDQYKMIGNAVPPKFAKVLANSVKDFLKKYN